MKIEIGKEYTITNKYKKSYVETEYLKNYNDDSGDIISVQTGWRSGTWTVTPQEEHEVEMLVEAMTDEFDDDLWMNDFENAEMDSSWDGCWDEWIWSGYKSKTGKRISASGTSPIHSYVISAGPSVISGGSVSSMIIV